MRRKALDFLVYLTVRLALCFLQTLSLEQCAALARNLGWLCWDVLRVRRGVVEDNLTHAYPQATSHERHVLARQMWEHLFLLAAEMAQAPRKIHWTNWRSHIELVRKDLLVRLLLDDRPMVMVSGHFGNFELSGFVLGILGFQSFTIARPLDNPYLHEFINRVRGANGQYILPKDGTAGQIDAMLARGATLTVLADQQAGPKGCWVDFFGRPASTHKAIALFALANDAPLAVCYCVRDGQPLKHRLGADEAIDPRDLDAEHSTVPSLTQWYTSQLERVIRRNPEQYWWVHRRWKGDPPRRKARSQAA